MLQPSGPFRVPRAMILSEEIVRVKALSSYPGGRGKRLARIIRQILPGYTTFKLRQAPPSLVKAMSEARFFQAKGLAVTRIVGPKDALILASQLENAGCLLLLSRLLRLNREPRRTGIRLAELEVILSELNDYINDVLTESLEELLDDQVLELLAKNVRSLFLAEVWLQTQELHNQLVKEAASFQRGGMPVLWLDEKLRATLLVRQNLGT